MITDKMIPRVNINQRTKGKQSTTHISKILGHLKTVDPRIQSCSAQLTLKELQSLTARELRYMVQVLQLEAGMFRHLAQMEHRGNIRIFEGKPRKHNTKPKTEYLTANHARVVPVEVWVYAHYLHIHGASYSQLAKELKINKGQLHVMLNNPHLAVWVKSCVGKTINELREHLKAFHSQAQSSPWKLLQKKPVRKRLKPIPAPVKVPDKGTQIEGVVQVDTQQDILKALYGTTEPKAMIGGGKVLNQSTRNQWRKANA